MAQDNFTKSKSNADLIEKEIFDLKIGHWSFGERIYKDFWSHVKEINSMFKDMKPLFREDRERLWQHFGEICNEVRLIQTKEFSDREFKSETYFDDIMELIKDSRINTLFGFDMPDIEEMKRLGNLLKRAGDKLSEKKHQMTAKHKQECFQEIKEVRSAHDSWWEDLKGHKQNRREDYSERIKENLNKNIGKHKTATITLEKLKDHREDLQDKIYSLGLMTLKIRQVNGYQIPRTESMKLKVILKN